MNDYDYRSHIRKAIARLEELSDRIEATPESDQRAMTLWAVQTSMMELQAFLSAEAQDDNEARRNDEKQEFAEFERRLRRERNDRADQEAR